MRRLFAFLLTLVLMFSLTGAGTPVLGGDPEPDSGNGIMTGALFSLGTINGDVYENSFIGYGCKLEGWTFADAEYIAQLNNISGSFISTDVQQILRSAGNFTEMFASSPDGLASVNIQYQDIAATYGSADVFADVSLEDLLAFVAPSMPSLLEQSGFQNVQAEAGTVLLGGTDHPGLIITSTFGGVPCYQKEACIRTDEYLIFVCVSSFQEDKTDELLSFFYPLSSGTSSEIVCFSPKDEQDFAFRYSNADWKYDIDSSGVNFTKESAEEETCRMVLFSQDLEGMEAFSEYMMELVFSAMKSEMAEQFDDIVFSEPADTVIGGKYSGRSMDMHITFPPLDQSMYAYMTAWTTDSRLYMLVAYTIESELEETRSMYSELLNSFEPADDYLARTGTEALEPAA